MRSSLIILSFFAIGVMIGVLQYIPNFLVNNDYSQWALYLLMFLVGINLGSDPNSLKALKGLRLSILLVPIITIIGTTLGVSVVYIFLKSIEFKDILAIGYGFGYYSLSSIFITELRGEELGVIALLANIIREVVTLLFAPFISSYFGRVAPIVSGGATSMDTTLPIISKVSGKEYAIVALAHGILLTILVPFLVTLVLNLT